MNSPPPIVSLFICVLAVAVAASSAVAQDPPPDAAPDPGIAPELASLLGELAELESEIKAAEGETRDVIEDQAGEKRDEIFALIDGADELGDSSAKAIELATAESRRLRRLIRTVERAARRHLAARKSSDPQKSLEAADGYARSQNELDGGLAKLVANIKRLEKLERDAGADAKFLDAELEGRAQRLTAVIRDSEERVAETVKRRPGTDDEKALLKSRVAELKDRRDAAIASLKKIVELMKARELETTEYQQLLIDSTGEITEDILDVDVAIGLVGRYLSSAKSWIVGHGPTLLLRLVLFLLIIGVFRVASRVARRIVLRLLGQRSSELLRNLVGGLTGRIIMLIGIIIGLWQFGFSVGPILAGLGIAGLVIGLALQSTLSNVAAGAMILAYRPFDVDDLIQVGGQLGVVKEMNLMSTTLVTLDSQRMMFPNSSIWGDVIVNVNAEPNRRIDLVFGIGYEDDVDRAREILESIVAEHEQVLDDPEPMVRLHNFGDSSVDFVVRPWVKTEDYWEVRWDINRTVKQRFDAESISIPFPQRDVHLHQVAARSQ